MSSSSLLFSLLGVSSLWEEDTLQNQPWTSIHGQHFVVELKGYDLYLKLGQTTSPQ